MKGSPLMGSLSRWFVLLVPLLFVDAILDLSFFGLLKPLVVPCCMVVYSGTATGLFNIGCPFCFITYKYPLLWGVIGTYAGSLALVVWSFLFQKSTRNLGNVKTEFSPTMKKVLLGSVILAVLGTILLLIQVSLGSFNNV
jgi:hypothetical protein